MILKSVLSPYGKGVTHCRTVFVGVLLFLFVFVTNESLLFQTSAEATIIQI